MSTKLTTGRAFLPIVGKSYEVSFGRVTYKGKSGVVKARIRIDGSGSATWIDLDTNAPLDPALAVYTVQGFREL